MRNGETRKAWRVDGMQGCVRRHQVKLSDLGAQGAAMPLALLILRTWWLKGF